MDKPTMEKEIKWFKENLNKLQIHGRNILAKLQKASAMHPTQQKQLQKVIKKYFWFLSAIIIYLILAYFVYNTIFYEEKETINLELSEGNGSIEGLPSVITDDSNKIIYIYPNISKDIVKNGRVNFSSNISCYPHKGNTILEGNYIECYQHIQNNTPLFIHGTLNLSDENEIYHHFLCRINRIVSVCQFGIDGQESSKCSNESKDIYEGEKINPYKFRMVMPGAGTYKIKVRYFWKCKREVYSTETKFERKPINDALSGIPLSYSENAVLVHPVIYEDQKNQNKNTLFVLALTALLGVPASVFYLRKLWMNEK